MPVGQCNNCLNLFLFEAPSRHLNRPKPWAFWPGGQDKSATTVIPNFHVPQGGTLGDRAATLPDGYYYTGMDSHFSDRKTYHHDN
jgi:hypothetical protein